MEKKNKGVKTVIVSCRNCHSRRICKVREIKMVRTYDEIIYETWASSYTIISKRRKPIIRESGVDFKKFRKLLRDRQFELLASLCPIYQRG